MSDSNVGKEVSESLGLPQAHGVAISVKFIQNDLAIIMFCFKNSQ